MPRNDRPPSFQFYPGDWLCDPAVDALTFDQQGRYWRALCVSWQTDSPGVASEDQWRTWMRYSTGAEWEANRGAHAATFRVSRAGVWTQRRMSDARNMQRVRREQAQKGSSATNAKRWGSVAQRRDSDTIASRSSVSPSSSSSSSRLNPPTPLLASPFGSARVRVPRKPRIAQEPPHFAEFYAAYPRHVARLAAVRAYRTALTRTDAAVLLASAMRYASEVAGRDSDKIKVPTTWLNGGCWLDEHGSQIASTRATPTNETQSFLTRMDRARSEASPPPNGLLEQLADKVE